MDQVGELYDALKTFVEDELRSPENPQLGIDPLNKVYDTETTMSVNMTGVRSCDPAFFARQLEKFRKNTKLHSEEHHTGTTRWIITLELNTEAPLSKRSTKKRRAAHGEISSFSTNWFLGYLVALMSMVLVGTFAVPVTDWKFILP